MSDLGPPGLEHEWSCLTLCEQLDVERYFLKQAADRLREGYRCPSWRQGLECEHEHEFNCAADLIYPVLDE